ncbi:DUF2795 domain-containing protein [Microbacterium sp.]|uniref:DUF2795 domain-containing protein n=1 Tax=Microbacterium sp. TaxID=51671 RepID=UPI002810ACC8|nr:DUF2795 domain-containing protein [Microbacterium sp.]
MIPLSPSLSPSLERFLADMEYPAMKDDLTREAARDGLPDEDLAALHALPDGGYDARCRLRDALLSLQHSSGLVAA